MRTNAGGDAQLSEGELQIGARLREARQRSGMTIDQVAESTGLSKGFLSQLERDLNSASIASLLKICATVGIDIASLFTQSRASLIRKDERPRWYFGGTGVRDVLLSDTRQKKVLVAESIIEPLGTGGDEPYALNADTEVVTVLEGTLEIRVGEDLYTLEAGDSLTFSPRDPHTWRNPSDSDRAVSLWVITPAIY